MSHHHGIHKAETKNIKVAFILNFLFVIVEIVGGILTNSVAILSDAAHDLGDSITLGISWYLQKVSSKEEDEKFTYGYRRYSVLGAIINLIILLFGCVFILMETIPRLTNPQEVNPEGMLILSILGILINYLAMRSLKKGSSLNEKVVSLHFLEDVLGWVAVFIGSVAMMIWDIPIIDPILSICIAAYILYNIYKNSKLTLDIILQRTPREINLEEIKSVMLQVEHVKGIEDLHIWSLDGVYHVSSVIVVFMSEIKSSEIKQTFENLHHVLADKNIEHITFEPKFV